MNRRRFVGVLGTGLAAGLVPRPAFGFARVGDDQLVERWSWAMGQAVHVMVFARSESEGLDACAAGLAELRRVESRLTLFDSSSDLCELNRCAGRRAFRADSDLLRVLEHAERYRCDTGGAFNVAGGNGQGRLIAQHDGSAAAEDAGSDFGALQVLED